MRVIIAGSREAYPSRDKKGNVIEESYRALLEAIRESGFDITVVLSGTAKGPDELGEVYAERNGKLLEQYPADWKANGKAAGFIRNDLMGSKAQGLIALWDGESNGTKHMIQTAKRRGLKVFVKIKEAAALAIETPIRKVNHDAPHKVYLAGEIKLVEKDNIFNAGIRRRLLSYHYHPTYDLHVKWSYEKGLDLFLDSGAFSAFASDKIIKLEEYIKALQKYGHVWNIRAALNSIQNDAEEGARLSYENFKKLRASGCSVTPTFHVRERDYWLERYINEGETRILIGGMVPESTPWLQQRLDHLFADYICNSDGTAKVMTHGFGLTAQQLIFRYPWTSCDSSSWIQKSFYGFCLFDTTKPGDELPSYRQIAFSRDSPELRKKNGHFLTMPKPQQEEIASWIEKFKIPVDEIIDNYRKRDIINVMTYQNMENHIPDTFIGKQPTLLNLLGQTNVTEFL